MVSPISIVTDGSFKTATDNTITVAKKREGCIRAEYITKFTIFGKPNIHLPTPENMVKFVKKGVGYYDSSTMNIVERVITNKLTLSEYIKRPLYRF